jgi:hypothetical protein
MLIYVRVPGRLSLRFDGRRGLTGVFSRFRRRRFHIAGFWQRFGIVKGVDRTLPAADP